VPMTTHALAAEGDPSDSRLSYTGKDVPGWLFISTKTRGFVLAVQLWGRGIRALVG